ncbi:MAG TPA: hypothetical protein VH815_09670 [Acidobacteriota bacterium]
MIKDLGMKTGVRIVQTGSSHQDINHNEEATKEPQTKIQLGIGSVSYAGEMEKQQLNPVEIEPKSLIDEIKKQRQAEQAERADVQEMQDAMSEMNKGNQRAAAAKSAWWDIFHFFSS